ncbi:MAG: trans-aconitate 2-methyltransferase [Hyphomicrobiales bacterium]|nr:trans-aconitate 2-methyltransferase [Hyphomicrobiales bacterium]
MPDWDAVRYRRFEDDRTRPSHELLARVPLAGAKLAYDLGCGPGNSTELIIARFPEARVIGVDSSPAMLEEARHRLPGAQFVKGDLAVWTPEEKPDLLFANAVFQWVPNHPATLKRLFGGLASGAVLAVQMPDNLDEPSHALMREAAAQGPWAAKMAKAAATRGGLPEPASYYDLLKPIASKVDIWHTIYNHVLENDRAIVDWVRSTGLRPFLDALEPGEEDAFLESYRTRLAKAFPPRVDGKVLLRFPRLFIVAERA